MQAAKLFNFIDFVGSLNESAYQIQDVNFTPEGGYEISVVDCSSGENHEKFQKIYIAKKTEKSLGLSFLDKKGKEHDCLWIPKDVVDIQGSGENLIVKIRPYSRWKSNPENTNKLEDFLEDFADTLETSKVWGKDRMKREAQDDAELLLDLLDYQTVIKAFNKSGDNQWEAELEDGKIMEITKRNPSDLMGTFKLYANKNSANPLITIVNSGNDPKTTFDIPEIGKTEIDGLLIGTTNKTPYLKYLLKKCLGTETASDRSDLYDYFQNQISKNGLKSDEMKLIVKLLSEFMDNKELKSLVSQAS